MNNQTNLLGAILIKNSLLDEIDLPDEAFDGTSRGVYVKMKRLYKDATPINDLTLLEAKVGAADIAELNQVHTAANWKFFYDKVKTAFKTKTLVKLANQIADMTKNQDPDDIVEHLEKSLRNLGIKSQDVHFMSDKMVAVMDRLEKRAKGELSTKCRTGMSKLDELVQFSPGELIIIGARPSVGKTICMLNMVTHMAFRLNVLPGVFSSEMSTELLLERVLSLSGGVNSWALRHGKLKTADFTSITDAADKIYAHKVMVDDTPNIKLRDLISKARYMKRKGVEIIFVDYLSLIRHPNKKLPRHERVGEASKSLKMLARELRIPVVALSQVRRDAEDRLPTLRDLRQSGEIEEDADIVLLLHRKEADLKINIAKNRNGPAGDILNMYFEKVTGRIKEAV